MKEKTKRQYYVMYGFNKNDIDETGFLGEDLSIVNSINEAKLFPAKNYRRKKDFKLPEYWLKFINEDDTLNNDFKFHLVKTLRQPTKK